MRKSSWRMLQIKRNPALLLGLGILILLAGIAFLAPWIAPYEPDTRCDLPYLKPSEAHFLGTNDIGQDIFSEMVWGTRVSLGIGAAAAVCSTGAGAFLGILAGYLGGRVDRVIRAVMDVMMALPELPLTMVLVAFLGGSTQNMIFIISATSWAGMARVIRSRAQQLREEPFVKIELALGASKLRIMLLHMIPNMADMIVTRFALSVGSAMTTESSLSFLGLGNYGQKSWGNVLHYAFYNGGLMRGFYWWYLPPVICISLSMLCFMLIARRGEKREGYSRRNRYVRA